MKYATYSLLAALIFITTAFSAVPFVHAQDDGYDYSSDSGSYYDDGTTYSGGCCDYSYTPDTSYSYTPDSSYSYTPDSSYSYTPDTSEYTYTPDSGYTYTPDSTYTYTPDTYTSDTYGSGMGSSFGLGASFGIGSTGYPSYSYPTYTYPVSHPVSYPSYPSNINTNVNTNVNTVSTSNVCSGSNVCNTTSSVATNPTPIITQPIYTTPIYTQPVYSQPIVVNPPVAYVPPPAVYVAPQPATPYVTLSQVPYTGLDLGPWGTAIYWGFLALIALVGMYLIAFKRVQNSIAHKVSVFLFGDTSTSLSARKEAADNFILSQISRY